MQSTSPALELIAKVVDINLESGEAALTRSATLQGYSYLINEIRVNINAGMTRDKAVVNAIDTCVEQEILVEFLTEHYSEVVKMLRWDYDADAEKRVLRQESHEEGRKEGHKEANIQIAQKLKKAGIVAVKEIAELTGLSELEIEQI